MFSKFSQRQVLDSNLMNMVEDDDSKLVEKKGSHVTSHSNSDWSLDDEDSDEDFQLSRQQTNANRSKGHKARKGK